MPEPGGHPVAQGAAAHHGGGGQQQGEKQNQHGGGVPHASAEADGQAVQRHGHGQGRRLGGGQGFGRVPIRLGGIGVYVQDELETEQGEAPFLVQRLMPADKGFQDAVEQLDDAQKGENGEADAGGKGRGQPGARIQR